MIWGSKKKGGIKKPMENQTSGQYKASVQLRIGEHQWRIEISASTLDELHIKMDEVIKDHEKRKQSQNWTRASS